MTPDPVARALAGDHRPAGDWPAPRRRPATYPGAAPRHPYLLVGDRVHPLQVRPRGGALHVTTTDGTPVDDVLRHLGVAPLADRVATVAYGANRGPDSLALKFAHHGPGTAVPPVPVVPVLAVTVADVDAVGAGLTSQGFVYADIVDSPGTRLAALLPLFDHHQLVAIHDSEAVGGAYDCTWLPDVELTGAGGAVLGAMAYVGRPPVFRDPDADQPLAFTAVAAEGRRFPAFEQVALLARVVEATRTAEALVPLLGLAPDSPPAVVAGELIRLVNGQWWYRHHSGDRSATAATEARRLLVDAMARSTWPRPPSSPLTRTVLTLADAYTPPPSLHVGHHLSLA